MWQKALQALVLVALFALSLLLLPGEPVRAERGDPPTDVRVVNLPEVQEVSVDGAVEVTGAVSVKGGTPAASLASVAERVSPGTGRAPAELVPAGILDADGFRSAVLSLAGEVSGRGGAGRLGAVLIPDTSTAARAFEDGRLLFPLETSAELSAEATWLDSEPVEVHFAFPRYRVYLYNTSARGVAARLYAYRAP